MQNIEIRYKEMTFIFHSKPFNGFYFTHKASGHGLYNLFQNDVFGRPTKNTALAKLAQYVESSPSRIDILNQYAMRYPG